MTTIRLTKRFVADVLRKEPLSGLTFGEFISVDNQRDHASECASCAVGTVIKRTLSTGTKAVDAADAAVVVQLSQPGFGWSSNEVDPSDGPWRALSKTYEQAVTQSEAETLRARLAQGRRAAIRYVEKHFPSHVEMEINGYEARKARGVTVVKSKAKQ